MIVPMEKVTALLYHKTIDEFLFQLQNLGLLHVDVRRPEVEPEALRKVDDHIVRCAKFLKAADKFGGEAKANLNASEAVFVCVEEAEKILEESEALKGKIEKLDKQISSLAPWGDFDIEQLRHLESVGLRVRFFIASAKKFDSLSCENTVVEVIERDKLYVYFVVFQKKDQALVLDCDEFFYPKVDRKKLQKQLFDLEAELEEKQIRLKELYHQNSEVRHYQHQLISRYAYVDVRQHLDAVVSGSVFVLSGWIPKEKKTALVEFLDQADVYSFFQQPDEGDQIPILLKNGRFARLFEPITKMFDLPHYTELDLTIFFAPFFALFFGLCLGDSGYGLFILLMATIAKRRVGKEKQGLCQLLQVLGSATFFCGLILGTAFGFDLKGAIGFKRLVLVDQDSFFYLAIILGLVQVLYGMTLKVVSQVRQGGFLRSLSTIGWIFLLVSLLAVTKIKIAIYGVWAGLTLILFFNDLKANIFVRFGKGLWELYGITGIFGDVLSYIRLFALGISSAILGLVINDSAGQMLSIPYVGFIIAPLFFVAFHALNLALSGLSSFVHPLRLTFVEFYKSAGFQGGGKGFKPFCHSKT